MPCWFISLKALYASISFMTSFIPFIDLFDLFDLFHLCHGLAPLPWLSQLLSKVLEQSCHQRTKGPAHNKQLEECVVISNICQAQFRFEEHQKPPSLHFEKKNSNRIDSLSMQFSSRQFLSSLRLHILSIVDSQTMSPHTLAWPPHPGGPRSAHIAIGSRKGAFVWKMCGWMLSEVCQVTFSFKLEWPGLPISMHFWIVNLWYFMLMSLHQWKIIGG